MNTEPNECEKWVFETFFEAGLKCIECGLDPQETAQSVLAAALHLSVDAVGNLELIRLLEKNLQEAREIGESGVIQRRTAQPPTLTPCQAAGVANVSDACVRQWAARYDLGRKVGGRWRIDTARLHAFLKDAKADKADCTSK